MGDWANSISAGDTQRLLDELQEPVLVCDANQTICFVNQAVARLLEWSASDLLGRPWNTIVTPGSREDERELPLLQGGSATTGNFRVSLARRDGVEFDVDVTMSRFVSDRGELFSVAILRPLNEDARWPEFSPRDHSAEDEGAEEEIQRLVFHHAPLGIFRFDAAGILTACNDYFVRTIHAAKHTVVGLNLLTLLDRDMVESVRATLAGRRAHYEGDYETVTSKRVVPLSVDFVPIRGAGGRIVGGIGIVEDTTERRRAEQALRRSEVAFRTLTESAPDGIAVYRDERFVYVNPAFFRALDYQRSADLLGQRVIDLIHPDDQQAFEGSTRNMFSTWEPMPPREKRMLCRGGGVVVFEIATLPIQFDGMPSILMHARDVSERKELAARLAQADRMASVGTLAAGVAHEINNPLAYVIGSLGLCMQQLEKLRSLIGQRAETDPLLGMMSEGLANARDGADRVRVIVRDLVTFSRAASETLVPVDIEAVLDSSVNLAWNEIRHRARLVKSYAGVPAVAGDEARLGQVFVNLLINAAQAIPEGCAHEAEIRLTTRRDGPMVVIEVEDTGCGMSPQVASRIFEPFFTTKPVGVGTGLGLAICHGIVGSLGGEIEVHSTQGKGSRFQVSLPIAQALQDEQPAQTTDQAVSAPACSHILIIDDEPLLGQTLRLAFEGKHDIVLATSGREGLARLQGGGEFDLILCDLMMPDVSGIAVYEQAISARPELEQRFVFMTGGAFTERAREFLENHPGARLDKPFDIGQVEELLKEHRS